MQRVRSVNPPLLVLVSALVLSSCATTDPYPEEWPPIIEAEKGDCSAFIGTFDNGYSASSHDAIPMKGGLIALLIGTAKPAATSGAKTVTRVSIEQPSPNRLVITGLNFSEFVRQGDRSLSGGSCSKKGLPVSGKFGGVNVENMVGFVSAKGYLTRAESGDLVARIRSTFTGIALVVPMTSSATSWYRFKRIEENPATADPVQ
ncbi:MAG: hypothetical protein WBQ30_07075 [Thermoanaerobaculia bacterium]